MKRLFMIFTVGMLLAACTTSRSSAPVQTTAPQIRVAQPSLAVPSSTSDVPSPSSISPTTTPTADASPSPAMTGTSTSSTAPLQVLSSQGFTMQEGFFIVGEIQNNTDSPMGSIAITITLYSKQSGKLSAVGTENDSTLLNVIPPKGKAPFLIGPYIAAQNIIMYDFHVQGQTTSLPRQDLTVQSDNSFPAADWLHLRGQVNNTSTTEAKYVKVIITLYDPKGDVVGAVSTYTNPPNIPAGGSAQFETATEHWPNFDHYVIQVQGQ